MTQRLLDAWRSSGPPFAPALCTPLLRTCTAHLEKLPPGSVIADIGCGDGYMVRALEQASYRAVGIDANVAVLRRGLVAGDGERLPLRDESVAGLFAFSVFQYMQRERALAECSRILRPGGRFAIVENLAGNPIAKLERLRRRIRRIPYPPYLEPRNHLSWRGRTVYERFFSEVRYEAHHVLAPALLLSRDVSVGDGNASLRAVQRVEQTLLGFPGAANLAWHIVIYGRR